MPKPVKILIPLVIIALAIVLEYPVQTRSQTPRLEAITSPTAPATQVRGFNFTVKQFTLTYQDQKFVVDSNTLAAWQGQTNRYKNPLIVWQPKNLDESLRAFYGAPTTPAAPRFETYHFQLDKIYDFVSTLTPQINQPTVEPKLTINNNVVAEFTPPQDGLTTNVYQTTFNIANALEKNLDTAAVTTTINHPLNTLAQTNSLGITELVAEGVSKFNGSPKNRRHNIAVGVEKMKGVLVAPGTTFSFNDHLGPVDGEHGFLPELVIKKEGTIPEFGGGLCQVSSTTFRAAMNAGLPIVERRNHAYAVQYYSPQGTDATIYPGVVDLKFTNDTPGYILIWPYEKDANTLIFDFYGTKDSRQVTVDKPIQWDRKEDGSMKASWSRTVIKDSQTKTDTFKSVYQPPALFHHDTQFVSATGTPATGLQMQKPQ